MKQLVKYRMIVKVLVWSKTRSTNEYRMLKAKLFRKLHLQNYVINWIRLLVSDVI